VCSQEERLDRESEGKDLTAPSSCHHHLDALHKVGGEKYVKFAEMLADICPALDQPLDLVQGEHRRLSDTYRSRVRDQFLTAAKSRRKKTNHSGEVITARMRARAKPVSARRMLEVTVSSKNSQRRRRQLNFKEERICS